MDQVQQVILLVVAEVIINHDKNKYHLECIQGGSFNFFILFLLIRGVVNMKSTTCFGKQTGQPLTEYSSEYDAQSAAEYASFRHGQHLTPYKHDKCNKWHLSPKDRLTPSSTCSQCTGSNMVPKALYETESAAQKRANILYEEQGIELKVYECRYSFGYHLTKGYR
jgi:hypothetical protein